MAVTLARFDGDANQLTQAYVSGHTGIMRGGSAGLVGELRDQCASVTGNLDHRGRGVGGASFARFLP